MQSCTLNHSAILKIYGAQTLNHLDLLINTMPDQQPSNLLLWGLTTQTQTVSIAIQATAYQHSATAEYTQLHRHQHPEDCTLSLAILLGQTKNENVHDPFVVNLRVLSEGSISLGSGPGGSVPQGACPPKGL